MMTGLTGAVKVPPTAKAGILNAVTGLITNSAANTQALAGYFQSRGLANNTINFGLNPQVMDVPGLTEGVTLDGLEATMVPLNPPSAYRAITGVYAVLAGNNHGLMPGSTAIAATVNTGNGTPQWNYGFRTAPGAAAIGILLSK